MAEPLPSEGSNVLRLVWHWKAFLRGEGPIRSASSSISLPPFSGAKAQLSRLTLPTTLGGR